MIRKQTKKDQKLHMRRTGGRNHGSDFQSISNNMQSYSPLDQQLSDMGIANGSGASPESMMNYGGFQNDKRTSIAFSRQNFATPLRSRPATKTDDDKS